MSGFARPIILNDSKFSLCSYGVLREKLKFSIFDKSALQEFRKTWGSFKGFYAHFNLHLNGQC